MSRTLAVVRREFTETIRSKIFIISTMFGPLLILGMFAFQFFMFRTSGGEKRIAIVDATPERVGRQVQMVMRAAPMLPKSAGLGRTTFRTELISSAGRDTAALRRQLMARVNNDELDGYLWLNEHTVTGDSVVYEGRNATVMQEMAQLQMVVQAGVHSARLSAAGVDAPRVASALRPVPFGANKAGKGAVRGDAGAIFLAAYFLGYLTFLVIVIYGAAVQRGVLEEKKDRIVEVVISSIRAEQLMLGKVLGIGSASLLQVGIWAVFATIALHFGNPLLIRLGVDPIALPHIPLGVGILFIVYFAGGYFLYSSFYAAFGALATSDQEGQQLMMPVILCLTFAYLASFRAMNAPDSTLAVVTSLVPLSSPLIVPVRAMMTDIPVLEVIVSLLLLFGTGFGMTVLGGRIYRIGMLTTGRRPTFAEVLRWLRTA
jgi:ABC-2 type transport system permease protein